MVNSAMPVVAQTTSLPSANRNTEDLSSPIKLCNEVITTPIEVPADTQADAPAGLPTDSHAAITAKAVAPPIAHSVAQAVAHHPTSLTDPIASKHHTATTRTQSMSYSLTALKPQTNNQKVPHLRRECQTA